jgi:hypothetical protein
MQKTRCSQEQRIMMQEVGMNPEDYSTDELEGIIATLSIIPFQGTPEFYTWLNHMRR